MKDEEVTPEVAALRAKFGKLNAFRRPNGERIVAARPAVPAMHVAVAHLAEKQNDPELLASLRNETFSFAGYVAYAKKEPYLVDNDGNILGRLVPGDNLIDETGVTKVSLS